MSDQTLTCRDCGQQFVFTAGEQAFYTERGFSPPMRCTPCRAKRKADRNSSGGGYDSAGYDGNGGGNGGYSSGPRQLYPAVCSNCGRATEVPSCHGRTSRSIAGIVSSRCGASSNRDIPSTRARLLPTDTGGWSIPA